MAKGCRDCGQEIRWENRVPHDADGADHRDTCPNKPPKPCRKCGEDVVWRRDEPKDAKTGEKHVCPGLVDPRVKFSSRHQISQYRLKRHNECPRQFFYGENDETGAFVATPQMDAGKLIASCIEFVGVERFRVGGVERLRSPVVPDDLKAALEVVVKRSSWSDQAFQLAHDLIPEAAPKIDLAFVVVDEHGPWIERGFELACGGDGVQASGAFDIVERVPSEDPEDRRDILLVTDIKAGDWRDPEPQKSPQVGLYAEKAHELWPECRVVVGIKYVGMDIPPDEIEWSEELGARAKANARAVVVKARAQRSEEDWPATGIYNGACTRCPFKAKCPEFKALVADAPRVAGAFQTHEPTNMAEAAAELKAIETTSRLFGNRVDHLRDLIKRWMREEWGGASEGVAGRFPVRLSGYKRKAYEVRETWVERLYVGEPLGLPDDAAAWAAKPRVEFTSAKGMIPFTHEFVQKCVDASAGSVPPFHPAIATVKGMPDGLAVLVGANGSFSAVDAKTGAEVAGRVELQGDGTVKFTDDPERHDDNLEDCVEEMDAERTARNPDFPKIAEAAEERRSVADRAVELDPEPCENCPHPAHEGKCGRTEEADDYGPARSCFCDWPKVSDKPGVCPRCRSSILAPDHPTGVCAACEIKAGELLPLEPDPRLGKIFKLAAISPSPEPGSVSLMFAPDALAPRGDVPVTDETGSVVGHAEVRQEGERIIADVTLNPPRLDGTGDWSRPSDHAAMLPSAGAVALAEVLVERGAGEGSIADEVIKAAQPAAATCVCPCAERADAPRPLPVAHCPVHGIAATPEPEGEFKHADRPCGPEGWFKRHRWRANGDPRCERCGAVRGAPKKKRTEGSLSSASSPAGEGTPVLSPAAPSRATRETDPCPSCEGKGVSAQTGFTCRDCKGANGSGLRDPKVSPETLEQVRAKAEAERALQGAAKELLDGVGDPAGDPGV